MRDALGYFVLALVLAIAGAGLWTTGRLQQRAGNARRQLLTLQYDTPLSEYDSVERSVRYAGALPWVASLVEEVREQRAISKYWHRDYAALTSQRDAGGTLVEQDPAILFVAANAAFRRARVDAADRSIVRQLDDILGQYAEVLKRVPREYDAAYNYEFVVRTRNALARPRSSRSAGSRDRGVPHFGPSTETIHGQPGAPPDSTGPSDFKIIVPQQKDERSQQPEAGVGGPKVRKG